MTAPDKNGWLPIETAPRDGTSIIAYGRFEGIEIVCWIGAPHEIWLIDGSRSMTPTHWQPLPKPPVSS